MYEIFFSETARKDIVALNKSAKEKLLAVLERLHINPLRYMKRVIGDKAYRLRCDSCKVMLDVDNETILVLTITKKGEKND